MCFGQNEAGVKMCRHCERSFEECGWSIWLPFAEVSGWQETLARRYQPKIVGVLKTKWPGCDVKVLESKNEFPSF